MTARETRDLGRIDGALCLSCERLTTAARCCNAEPVPLDEADPSAVIHALELARAVAA